MTRIIHFFASKLAYTNKKHYLCDGKAPPHKMMWIRYSVNYGTQILSSLWCCVYLSARESCYVPMRRRGTLSCCSCSSGRAIPQPMPLPQVPHRIRNIQLTPFLHVYLFPHILHHCLISLPYSGMAAMLDNSTPVSSQHALCTLRIYWACTCGNILRHHALWLLVRA